MLSVIFYWVLNLSILGSLCGILLLLIRKIPKMPPILVYLLWFIPLIRFYIPFGIVNPYSLQNIISKFTSKTVAISQNYSMSNYIMAADRYFPIAYKTNLLEKIFSISFLIWSIVAIALILVMFSLYFTTKSELKNSEHVEKNIYKSDKILSPAVYGIFNSKIIIPSSLAESNIDYIVMHEAIHIKHHDNLFRSAAIFTACIHWFNPFVWVLLKYFFADMEFACDYTVIKKLGKQEQKRYASALFYAASGKTFFASCFGGANTKVRIEKILSYKKLTIMSALCFVTLFIVVTTVLLTNAVS